MATRGAGSPSNRISVACGRLTVNRPRILNTCAVIEVRIGVSSRQRIIMSNNGANTAAEIIADNNSGCNFLRGDSNIHAGGILCTAGLNSIGIARLVGKNSARISRTRHFDTKFAGIQSISGKEVNFSAIVSNAILSAIVSNFLGGRLESLLCVGNGKGLA